MSTHPGAANETLNRRKEVAALAAPAPGEVLQGFDDGFSEGNAAQRDDAILISLQDQQEAEDTACHRIRVPRPTDAHSSGNNSSNSSELQCMTYNHGAPLEELFHQRPPVAPQVGSAEFQEPGGMDFRAALFAEQQQQEAILRERQQRFEEKYQIQNPRHPGTPASSPDLASTTQTSSPLQLASILKGNHPTTLNTPKALPQPNPVTNGTRGHSLPTATQHNRTVSWNLDKLVSTAPEDGTGSARVSKTGMPLLPVTPTNSYRPRPRLLSEDNAHYLSQQRVKLKDVIGMTPFESEAETNIMRAVDEFGLQQHYEYAARTTNNSSESSPFFSNLPDDFTLPSHKAEEAKDGSIRMNGHYKTVSELTMDHPEIAQRQPAKKPTSPRQRKARPKTHRHTMSVEEKLFDLTAQLDKLDAGALEHFKHDTDDDEADEILDNWDPAQQNQEENNNLKNNKGHNRVISTAERLTEKAHSLVANALRTSQHTASSSKSHPWSRQPATDIESPSSGRIASEHNGRTEPVERAKVKDEIGNNSVVSNGSPGVRSSPPSPARSHFSSTIFEQDEEASFAGDDEVNVEGPNDRTGRKQTSSRFVTHYFAENMREDWETFNEFLSPRKRTIWSYCKTVLFLAILPSTGVAMLFFYFLENPEAIQVDPASKENESASISWIILFVGVRQVLTFSLALTTQSILIDFFLLGSRFSLRILGPILTLLLVQSKGWPFILTMWACFDLGLLAGSSAFVNHWCYWQDVIGMLNESNPSGNVTANDVYYKSLRLAIAVGSIVALKRLIVGVFLSRQTFLNYSSELAAVMQRMVLISEIATFSRLPLPAEHIRNNVTWREKQLLMPNDDETSESDVPASSNELEFLDLNSIRINAKTESQQNEGEVLKPSEVQPSKSDASNGQSEGVRSEYTENEKQLIIDLLERWEDPERVNREMAKKVTLGAVLQFRRALTLLKRRYPFSPAFGPAQSREICIDLSSNVYDRLLQRNSEEDRVLNFDVLAVLATDAGDIDEDKLRDMIKMFRPDRDGRLTRLAFVKSIDATYKRMRFLSANIHNSSQIDIAIFFSLSSFILVSCSERLQGSTSRESCLYWFKKPFGVGDRIHVSNSESEASPDGSAGWIVERVNLFNTTVCYGTTNERATISNGTLASSRIINAARSPNALIYVNLKFGIDVPFDKIQIFQAAVEVHVKARPREWLSFCGFRAGLISVDRGFIEYKVVVQHREAWQNIISILDSKARLTTYCLEVAKKLEMRYRYPPMGVDLNVFNTLNAKELPLPLLPQELQSNPVESTMKTA